MVREGDGRPDRGIVMGSLRARFAFAIVVALAGAVILQVLAVNSARSSIGEDGLGSQPSLVVPTVLSSLGTFCVWTAGALALGIVATFVIDEAFVRRYEIDAIAEGDDSSDGGAVPAYGSDPERL